MAFSKTSLQAGHQPKGNTLGVKLGLSTITPAMMAGAACYVSPFNHIYLSLGAYE